MVLWVCRGKKSHFLKLPKKVWAIIIRPQPSNKTYWTFLASKSYSMIEIFFGACYFLSGLTWSLLFETCQFISFVCRSNLNSWVLFKASQMQQVAASCRNVSIVTIFAWVTGCVTKSCKIKNALFIIIPLNSNRSLMLFATILIKVEYFLPYSK